MPRKRDIDPSLWSNEQLADVARDARLLYIGLISHADDEGRLRASPRALKAAIFPYDDELTVRDLTAWLDQLTQAGVLCCYEHEGERYAHL
jgi:hypothetical protein